MLPIRTVALAAIASLFSAAGASAQVTFENNGLSGEMSAAGTGKTGNTDSTDLGLGMKLRHETDRWRNILGVNYDWGSAEELETKNRAAGTYELARLLNDRIYGFGRAAYEQDAFSGYEYRSVLGGGLGVDVIRGDNRTWSLQGGPAYRLDEIEPQFDATGALAAPGETQTAIALNLGSRFETQVNDAVSIRNDTDVTSSVDTTTLLNSTALTSQLMGDIAARLSFDVAHDTNAPFGKENTDTTTRVALVYSFGGAE